MKKILVIRASAIGDVVFASPLAASLRRTYPDAHIAWLIDPGIEPLVRSAPYVDECILWPQAEWLRLWRAGKVREMLEGMMAFRKTLKEQHFDVAIDLQGLLKSGLPAWMTGAPRRIGLGSREGGQWLMTEVFDRGGEAARISSEYLYLAQQLGLKTQDFMPELHLDPAAETRAIETLRDFGLVPGRYVVFAAFTTRPQKHWFPDAWQALATQVRQQTGLVPVLLGGPADRTAADQLVSGAPDMVSLVGKTRLDEAAAMVRHAGALIGVDTGLTHMGIAFSIPTVAIFGSTCPYTDTQRPNAKVIWLGMSCSPCRRKPTCGGAWTCLRNITPEWVMQELETVLERSA